MKRSIAAALLLPMVLGSCSLWRAGSEDNPTGTTHLEIAQFGDLRDLALHDGKDRTGFNVSFAQTVRTGCEIPGRPDQCKVTETQLSAQTTDSNGSAAQAQALAAQADVMKTQADTTGKAVDVLGGIVGTAVKGAKVAGGVP